MEITLESRLKIATKEHYYTLERFLDHYVDKGGSYEDYDKFINDGLLTTNLLSFICNTYNHHKCHRMQTKQVISTNLCA
jgi:hypothetical protein